MKNMLLLASVLLFASCTCSRENMKFSLSDNRPVVTEQRALKGFEAIEITGSPTVYYQQADSFSVKVKGPQELVDCIITDVSSGTLSIRNRGKVGVFNIHWGDDTHLAVYVTSPDLVSVRVAGSGEFISQHPVDTDVMDISLKGSGDVEFAQLLCDRCNLELVGSGDATIHHLDTRQTDIALTGSGDVDVSQINAVATRICLRGSGDVDVNFGTGCGSVDADLHGSGDISLSGRVRSFTKQKHGSGDIDTDRLEVGN